MITNPSIFFETASQSSNDTESLFFKDFEEILIFKQETNVETFFERIERYRNDGYWICGYFDYSFGQFLDPILKSKDYKEDHVFAWLGVCKMPIVNENNIIATAEHKISELKNNISFKEYDSALSKIKEYLRSGDTYQVNYTFKRKFKFSGDVKSLYCDLKKAQPTDYMAFIDTGKKQILSFSPELFFKVKKDTITVRPMKGTIKRALTTEGDKSNKAKLLASEKDKAENLMIVDLLRNDIGKICDKVETKSLFDIEKYKTVYQMTSTVEGKLKDKLSLFDVFKAVYPCGSITGAPKVRTMEIIKGLEQEPRGVYTGAIGYFAPNGDICFNVAIRTIDISNQQGEIGVGGGIIIDSNSKLEFDEAILKSEFINQQNQDFSLLETMLWTKEEGYVLKEQHIKRLLDSAEYFDYVIDRDEIEKKLGSIVSEFNQDKKYRIRILLNRLRELSIKHVEVENKINSNKIAISDKKVNSNNLFLYHKTTNREFYNKEWQGAKEKGLIDYIFLNQQDELTEGCISNLFIETDGQLYTPPIESGLLPGILRASLIESGKVEEKKLYLDDIKRADCIFMGNSVKGLVNVFID